MIMKGREKPREKADDCVRACVCVDEERESRIFLISTPFHSAAHIFERLLI